MNMSSIPLQYMSSVKQALGMSVLRKSMNQDASTVSALISGIKSAGAQAMEHSVNPHIGGNVDIRV
ncbi:putative motility protein YjfB-like [Anaerobacterium chartisolvens]|uniref:Putative motility protein YjfB-like n=1 Tax=Anaerobacterium chartisolvens TaxID=1297424 RepID=A0A369AWA9_9FIRM|nr:YjfB family protein [Anaerobacterium chartisolvens]RCX12536.1 putative motility protein YjfB-like [Anaerobacterium chartisolvens]